MTGVLKTGTTRKWQAKVFKREVKEKNTMNE